MDFFKRHTHTRSNYMLPTRGSLNFKDTYRLKVKGWKKILHANNQKSRDSYSQTIKIDFKSKTARRDKIGNYIITKG